MFSPVIALHEVSYTTPDLKPLFTDLNLAFGVGRTGLIGRNGVGKSTLLKLITGELLPDSGTIIRDGRLGVLRQTVQIDEHETIARVLGVEDDLARLERVLHGAASDTDLELADWSLEPRIDAALAAVDLAGVAPDRRLATLSGGQRTRVALAALLFAEPDMILLDEPTNNLDRAGREAVARVLAQWRGGAIVVSHDRALLRRMDRIVELTTIGARVYGGNWDLYQERKEEERAAAIEEMERTDRQVKAIDRKVQQEREKLDRRAARGKKERVTSGMSKAMLNGMRNRSEQTRARGVQIAERMKEDAAREAHAARARVEKLKPLEVDLWSSGLPAGRTVLLFEGVSGGPDAAPDLIHDLSFEITGPERVAVTGPNGSGKTTLLRLATGDLEPSAGRIRRTPRLIALDQQARLLDPAATIVDNFRRLNPEDEVSACRAALARFLFGADAATKLVADLSGGETLRAGLACVLGCHHPPELLVLDEPTNHLDLYSIAAIEEGLRSFDGALLVVSHDEDFLAAIGIERRFDLPLAPAPVAMMGR